MIANDVFIKFRMGTFLSFFEAKVYPLENEIVTIADACNLGRGCNEHHRCRNLIACCGIRIRQLWTRGSGTRLMDRRTFVKAGCIGSASLLMQGLDPMVRCRRCSAA